MSNKNQTILVERETYEKGGKTFYTYFIKGKLGGKDAKIALSPPDIGGYTVLDIVFGSEKQAELVIRPYEIKDEKTGESVKGNTYLVRSFDENGEIYECPIKPARASDKALLNMLIR